jgi:hypothetical protein
VPPVALLLAQDDHVQPPLDLVAVQPQQPVALALGAERERAGRIREVADRDRGGQARVSFL